MNSDSDFMSEPDTVADLGGKSKKQLKKVKVSEVTGSSTIVQTTMSR